MRKERGQIDFRLVFHRAIFKGFKTSKKCIPILEVPDESKKKNIDFTIITITLIVDCK